MLQLKNTTPFAARLMLFPDRDGIDTIYTVVKGTFSIGGEIGLAAEQTPVTLKDEHHGDPATSSIRIPSDVSLEKPGTDVVVVGSACAPRDEPAWTTDVSVAVGPVAKSVRVFADRFWDANGSPTWSEPFMRVPLVWERAFGGRDETEHGPAMHGQNPVGIGFRAPHGAKSMAGLPLPNVEDPSAPISSWKDTPAPAGLGAIAPHWLPRRSYAGTYDDAWQKTRAPYLPADFDDRFCQVAAPGLATPSHLAGGEVVDLRGVTPGGALHFALPAIPVQAMYRLDRGADVKPAKLDTLIIDTDAGRLVMVWRAALRCDKKALKVREVRVSTPDTRRAVA